MSTARKITPYMEAVLMLARFDLQYHALMMAARSVNESRRPLSEGQVAVLRHKLDELANIAAESKPDWSKISPEQPAAPEPVKEDTRLLDGPDEYLAMQFAVNNGGQVIPNPANW